MMKARFGVMLVAIIVSICMLVFSFIGGGLAYGAEQPAGTDDFDYNGYSASQLKAISECIAGIPGKPCPSYSASTVDHYTGTQKHANMPTGVISTKDGWLQWADAAMKANRYDGVYGLVKLSSANDTTHSVKDGSSIMYFRLVGINQDDRSDGLGKAGLTFQAVRDSLMPSSHLVSYYNNGWNKDDSMNKKRTNSGGWRDSELRKSMNNGIIWKAFPSDFKDNVTTVNKTTNNDYYAFKHETSVTADKLWILSPSEMGMPIIAGGNQVNADVHVYVGDGGYDDIAKSTIDGNRRYPVVDYLYSNDTYQWWMLPAGYRKMSNGKQSYHNTDSYSYCTVFSGGKPSSNTSCLSTGFWLRSHGGYFYSFAFFKCLHGDGCNLDDYEADRNSKIIPAFSF